MKPILSHSVCALTLLLAGAAQGTDWWDTVHSLPIARVTVGGETRAVYPRCALGDDYQFYFKAGNVEQLVVYFAGGGACWDSATCIGSLGIGVDEGEESDFVYIGSIDKADNPEGMGGLFNLGHPDNPYADWSMLFIPYCTGDVHVGSSDTTYLYPRRLGGSRTIRHRGFDNFLYAMNWLKKKHPEVDPVKILVAGSSAGAYGATLNFPWVHEFYPDADEVYLASDAGVGVLTDADDFSDAVFGIGSVWKIRGTVHPDLKDALNDYVKERTPVIPAVYNLLRTRTEYPNDKFAQYTTAYDVVQVLFWDIMLNPNPMKWGQGISNEDFVGEWNIEMNAIIQEQQQIALTDNYPDNYRSYIAPGCNHTIFGFDDDFYGSSLISSTEVAISFLQWLSSMTDGAGEDWQNLTCSDKGDCGVASLDPNACLTRSYPPDFPM